VYLIWGAAKGFYNEKVAISCAGNVQVRLVGESNESAA
jgi:hypothetical protein